jgi:serine/threonine-protein kinase
MAVSVTDLAGRVFAGRYRLLAPIGTGASGRVYRAEDTTLRRHVAVKVLHAALADDAGFLRRFRAEAQVAASLQHPHVMTVFDWGEDDVPFMVLELLEGGSLRAMLDEGTFLSPGQAARVARDVATALEYAHARGIVHRDIKPANLLFDEHGIVRVADFGLARALAEASWTEPMGAVLGTARYASPEQALGTPLDARSDLYSLALVIVESITGKVPFAADTTVGTLTARTQRSIVAPEELGPLAAVVERAGRVDPGERYPDAATMAEALADAVDALPRPGPLVLPGAADGADRDPTRAVPRASVALFDQDAEADAAIAPPVPAQTRHRARRRWVPVVTAIVGLLALVAAVVAFSSAGGSASAVAVPGLVGRTQAGAERIADANGFEVDVAARVEAPDPPGTVISQEPAGGELSSDRTVRVVVSRGPATIPTPDLAGMSADDALRALDDAGLVADMRPPEYSASVQKDLVARQQPAAGEDISPDSKVSVWLSAGPPPVEVPLLRNEDPDDAVAALEDLGLNPRVVRSFNAEIEEGLVVGTDPGPGVQAPAGSEIVVVVSRGPVLVPDLEGLSIDDATAVAERQGFDLEVQGRFIPDGIVESQNPDAGDRARPDMTVRVRLTEEDD